MYFLKEKKIMTLEMTTSQIKDLEVGQGEIQRFEDFRFPDDDAEDDIPFEEIRKSRKK